MENILTVLNNIEEEEEEEFLQLALLSNQRISPHDLFLSRENEGFQKILIERHLLKALVEEALKRQSCGRVRHPISPSEKLGLTLRFMATGESYASLSYAFRISPSYIRRIVKEVLQITVKKLLPIFIPTPTTSDLLTKASEFYEKWNFPNCIAAVDGKHVRIFCPGKSGSLFFNYKDYFSIVLLAFVDANYKFIMIDVGSYGKEGDSGILQKSIIGKLIENEEFYPPSTKLPNSSVTLPYVIVGDETFRLSTHMMKPFTRNDARLNGKKAVFNYRLSRARRVSENAFALLSQVFRIFYTPIAVNPEVSDNLIMTACCLHNMLRDAFLEEKNIIYFQMKSADQLPTNNLISFRASGGFGNAEGFEIRNKFSDYFIGDAGSISWQQKQVTRTS